MPIVHISVYSTVNVSCPIVSRLIAVDFTVSIAIHRLVNIGAWKHGFMARPVIGRD